MAASDFAELVPACCSEVLDAMYFTTVLETTHTPPPALAPDAFAFSLHFAGDVAGDYGVSLGESSARLLASNFLGEDESTLTRSEIGEVVGELANMLCGSVVSRIGGEQKFILSHPEPIAAYPDVASAAVLLANLETDSGPIVTWVVVEGSACA